MTKNAHTFDKYPLMPSLRVRVLPASRAANGTEVYETRTILFTPEVVPSPLAIYFLHISLHIHKDFFYRYNTGQRATALVYRRYNYSVF